MTFFKAKTNFFKNFFFPAVIIEWSKIDVNIRNLDSCNDFKNVVLKFIRPEPNQVLNFVSSEGLKFLTRVRLGLSHLSDHKFRHNFQDFVNLVCSCGQEIETSTHFICQCSNYYCIRQTLFEKVNKIDSTIFKQNDLVITKFLQFSNGKL